MSSDVPEVVLQGIEFWSTVCEMEINLNFEEAEVGYRFCLALKLHNENVAGQGRRPGPRTSVIQVRVSAAPVYYSDPFTADGQTARCRRGR